MCNEFVCVHSDSCIYSVSPEYCCLDVACVIFHSQPCSQCMLKSTSCRRKRTDSLNRTFANSTADYSQEVTV